MSIIRQINWTVQPQSPVGVNRSGPSANITHLVPLGAVNREIVNGSAVTFLSGGSIAPDHRGLSLRGSVSAGVASVPLNLSAYNKLTISYWLYWDTFANDDHLAMEFTATANSNNGFYIDPNSSAPAGAYSIKIGDTSANENSNNFARPSGAAWHHYMHSLDRSVGAVSGIVNYVDGALVTSTIRFAQSITGNFANDTLYIFSRNNASLFAAGRMQNLAIRGGYVCTASDAAWEYSNGWQLFAPLPRRIWNPGAAVAAANLMAQACL